jgi:hypothetical protein
MTDTHVQIPGVARLADTAQFAIIAEQVALGGPVMVVPHLVAIARRTLQLAA